MELEGLAAHAGPKLITEVPGPEAMARIVDHALEFKREDRYPSAATMRAMSR